MSVPKKDHDDGIDKPLKHKERAGPQTRRWMKKNDTKISRMEKRYDRNLRNFNKEGR